MQDSQQRPPQKRGPMTLKVLEVDCDMAIAQLWDYLDGELTPERMTAVKLHLERCSHCLPHAIFGEKFLKALHDCSGPCDMPEDLRTRVMERLRSEGLTS